MKAIPSALVEDEQEEITALVRQLQETQQRLEELTGGQVDAVAQSGGRFFLLHEAQEKLRRSEQALRRSEAATLESETKFRALFNFAADAMFMLHRGVCGDCNAKALELCGVTRDQLIGQSPGRFSPLTQPDGQDSQRKFAELLQRAEAGEPQFFEWKQQRPDRTTVEVEVSLSRFDLRGEHYIQCIAHDITKRKRTESRFRRLVNSNAQGVIFWNAHGGITEANDAFLNLLRYSREELRSGKINWMALTAPEYAELDRRALRQLASTGTCEPYEKEFIRQDGSRVPVLIGAAAFDDSPDEGVAFIVDLTANKKLEQHFFRAQRVESIGALAGGIAHDLNNILAPIMMSIDILKLSAADPQTSRILHTIHASAKRGAEIVRQVLTFARGHKGERIEVQPAHLVRELKSILADTFPKTIALNFTVPADSWTILADPTQVHQILLNLCLNARDAMPDGGSLTIAVDNCVPDEHFASMQIAAKAGRYVKFTTTDSGTGIPPGILGKIFEPFFTTKEPNQGTGLGLSTVLAIVKHHDGFINVSSEPGQGTTFQVYLPAVEVAAEGDGEPAPPVNLPRGDGETILLVDDEIAILTIESETLQAYGYRVLTASDGAAAVAVYAEHQAKIAIVVTDMNMPIMTGPAVIRSLMKINPAIKIIAASGLHQNGEHVAPSGSGIKCFLLKPYTAESLLKTIRRILDEV